MFCIASTLQWVADDQPRRDAGNVALFGDLPFMVSGDSADVWARQDEFRLDASIGVPPDAFSETGQNWEMPVYRWDVLAERGFDWLRDRARRNAALFDGYRVDHLVGFYRTYFRPHDGSAAQFSPPDEPSQEQLGECVLEVFRSSGAYITAEDLGIVPQFVRDSLARKGIAGYKVLRWERYWHQDGQPFKDPRDYPPVGVATSGTHDTEPMATWWQNASRAERQAVLAIPSLRARLTDEDLTGAVERAGMSHSLREALLGKFYVGFGPPDISGSGRLRLARPHQPASYGERFKLDLAAAMASGQAAFRATGDGGCRAAQGVGRE